MSKSQKNFNEKYGITDSFIESVNNTLNESNYPIHKAMGKGSVQSIYGYFNTVNHEDLGKFKKHIAKLGFKHTRTTSNGIEHHMLHDHLIRISPMEVKYRGPVTSKTYKSHEISGHSDCHQDYKKYLKESEQIDELSKDTLSNYSLKARIKADDYKTSDKTREKRLKGSNLALKKIWGDPKYGFSPANVPADGKYPSGNRGKLTKEEIEILEELLIKSELLENEYIDSIIKELSGQGKGITPSNEELEKMEAERLQYASEVDESVQIDELSDVTLSNYHDKSLLRKHQNERELRSLKYTKNGKERSTFSKKKADILSNSIKNRKKGTRLAYAKNSANQGYAPVKVQGTKNKPTHVLDNDLHLTSGHPDTNFTLQTGTKLVSHKGLLYSLRDNGHIGYNITNIKNIKMSPIKEDREQNE